MEPGSRKGRFTKPVGQTPQNRVKHPILRRDLAVLVLGPELDILDEVAALLRRRGVTVHTASVPEQALAMLETEPRIGVVLGHVDLLEGAGLELASRVINSREPAVELVLIAGEGGPDPRTPGLMAELGLLQEPLRLRDIAISVGRALGRAAARRAMGPRGTEMG
jgi:DNA-binding NtrC family response regulator